MRANAYPHHRNREEQPGEAGAVTSEDVGEVMDTEVQPAEADRGDEDRDAGEACSACPLRAKSTPEDVRERSVEGDGAQRVPAREREPAGGRDRVAEARPRTLEGRFQEPGQELRAEEADCDENHVAVAFAS